MDKGDLEKVFYLKFSNDSDSNYLSMNLKFIFEYALAVLYKINFKEKHKIV